MRRIEKLILQAIIPPMLISAAVLTFVVYLKQFGQVSELLVTRNASLLVIGLITATILPGILVFSLPMSFLIGILIGLSRLSGDSEITALRACGVPIRRLLVPVFALGAVALAVTLTMTLVILPRSNSALHDLKDRINLRQTTAGIAPRVFYEELANFVFYLDDFSLDRQKWSRVFLSDNSNPNAPRIVLAREGTWVSDRESFRLQLHLEHGRVYEVNLNEEPGKDNVSEFESTDIPVALVHDPSVNASGEVHSAPPKKTIEESSLALWRGRPNPTPAERRDQLIELHRRIALPFSVLSFSLLGLALGIGTRKAERASGFVLSFILVLVFYNLFLGGIRLASVGNLPPWLGAWGANIILLVLGLALMATAERGIGLFNWIAGLHWGKSRETPGHWIQSKAEHLGIRNLDTAIVRSTRQIAGLRFPKILDVYVSKGFCLYFLWSVLVCASLFIILTLFDLLDDIIRNRTAAADVVDYFVFLTPQILLLVVPMCILLAILINFGILEKSSEVTALKAGGWSLYRIAMPIFFLASCLCVSLYLLQDYVLPYSNIRQDSLRKIIKGRPAQTSMRPQRKWIFGESNRIFNYDYFDPSQKLFVGLNIFEVDLHQQKILRRIHAARASVREDGVWTLEGGWIRNFESKTEGFQRISRAEFTFPERASYFQKEIFEPKESSKLTYLQLKEYIKYLEKSGFNATELQVELYKKISFPLSSVVMALVGVPFSFSMGRKGAFFGITASILVAMSYWGVFGVFEQMGAYGLLVPLLAAWAPNILFGAAGLVLLFTIRT